MGATLVPVPAKVIYLPVMVVFCNNELIRMTGSEFRNRHCRVMRNGHLLFSRGSNPHFRVTHLLDRRGYFHKITELKKRRAFLSWLASLWDFTGTECAVKTFQPMTVRKLLEEAKRWKNDAGQKLRRLLAKENQSAIFDEAMFRKVWESMYIKISESEWQQVLEIGRCSSSAPTLEDPDFGIISFDSSDRDPSIGIWQMNTNWILPESRAKVGCSSIPGTIRGPYPESRMFLLDKKKRIAEIWNLVRDALTVIRDESLPVDQGKSAEETFYLSSIGLNEPIQSPPRWSVGFETERKHWLYVKFELDGEKIINHVCDT